MTFKDALYQIHWRNVDKRRFIRRGDIIDYFDELFFSGVQLWKTWKLFGLPQGGGWLSERPRVVQVITIVEEERLYYQDQESEKRKSGNSGRAASRHKR